MAHRGQSRALLLRRRGRVQSYTPSAYSSQNVTLSRTASADSIGACCPVCKSNLRRRIADNLAPAGRVAVCRGTPLSCLDRGYPVLHSISEGGSSQTRPCNAPCRGAAAAETDASADSKQTVICQLINRNLCDMFYALKDTIFSKLIFHFYKIQDITHH